MGQSIVVGVDGSAGGAAALAEAAAIAERTGALLAAVFVRSPALVLHLAPGYDGVAEPIIDEALAQLIPRVREAVFDELSVRPLEWTFDVLSGHPAAEIVDAALSRSSSMIVVGASSHGRLGGLVLGSVAQKLVCRSPVSVLVVRPTTAQHQDAARSGS
jgi:nucleotide-binding universal stress UspA family protein